MVPATAAPTVAPKIHLAYFWRRLSDVEMYAEAGSSPLPLPPPAKLSLTAVKDDWLVAPAVSYSSVDGIPRVRSGSEDCGISLSTFGSPVTPAPCVCAERSFGEPCSVSSLGSGTVGLRGGIEGWGGEVGCWFWLACGTDWEGFGDDV